MRKLFLTLGAIVLVAIGGALYFISYRLDGVVETRIEKAATIAFGTAVEVAGVHTNLREGTLKIAEISVANPPGFNNPYAVQLHEVEAAVDYSGREITRVVIRNPEFFIEENGGGTNFEQMLQSLEAADESGTGRVADSGAGSSEVQVTEPVIVIKHFRVEETRAVFESRSLDRFTDIEVDAIEMYDLRGTPSELATLIAREVVGEISSEADTEILKTQAKKQLKGVSVKAKDVLQGLLRSGKDDDTDESTDTDTDTGAATDAATDDGEGA